MKYPTLQKVTLMAMALVVSLALGAQARTPALSSATQKNGKKQIKHAATAHQTRWHEVLFPNSTYMLDDGTAEDSIGLTIGGDIISLNEFAVLPGAETITTVSIAWGTPAFPDPSLNGLPYTVAIWSDPNGDGSPTDAVLLNTASGVVASAGTDTFITTDIPDTTITTANFFVGFLITHAGGQFPAAFDQTAPTFSNRSYVAGGASGNISNLNMNDLPVAPIESFGLVGNWLIRADSSGNVSPTPTPTPTATPAGALWYNGDFDGVDGLTNEENTFATGYSHIYDDFDVNDAEGWDVDSVFSNNLANTNIIAATWEIRSGVSAFNGGTIVASGTTMTPVITPTGRSGFGFTEFMVEVTGLSVHLDGNASYHLNVTPVGPLDGGRSFDSTTSGANCIGTPCGNNDNAFLDSTLFGANFEPVADFGSQFHDFSMGVNGVVSGGGGGMTQTGAFSRKHHSVAGDFDIALPGVEPREGNGGTFLQTFVFTFSDDVTSISGATTTTCGTVNSTTFSGNTVIVELGHVNCNGSDITVTVNGVTGASGSVDASATMSLLVGDVTGDGTVDQSDVNAIRMNVGKGKVNSGNFIYDINVDGKINHGDTKLAKAQL